MKRKKSAAFFAPAFIFFIFQIPLFSQPAPRGKRVPPPDEKVPHNSPNESNGFHHSFSPSDKTPRSDENIRSDEMMHYRGMRMFSSCSDFYVTEIEFEEKDNAKIKIKVKFSSQINPRTVNVRNFLLNGKPFPENSRISFSKKGNKFEIEFPYPLLADYYSSGGFFTLSLGDIKSFSDVPLQESVFADLYLDCEYEYHLYRREDGTWFIWREEDD